MFQPMNVQGPANRAPQMQQIAQGVAAKMAQRGKLRALLAQTMGGGAAGIMGGAGNMARGSFEGRAMGAPGDVYRPMMLPGYGFGPGGRAGSPEFGSIPSPGDPHQSPGSVAGPHFIPPQVHSPTAPNNAAALPHPSSTPPAAAGAALNSGASFNDPTAAPAGGNLIPLGNGLHYDPVTDTVVGGGYGNSSTSG